MRAFLRPLLPLLLPLVLSAPLVAQGAEESTEGAEHYAQDYDFTTDWFLRNIPTWKELLEPYRGEPDVQYLEIGLFEGRSALWMLENVLTHPSSRLTGIDPFDAPGLLETWNANLAKSGAAERATTIRDYSYPALRQLPLETYDIIYIDGSHMAHDVLADAALGWGLLRPGGLMLFDDYGLIDEWPSEIRPGLAIDCFVTTFRNYLEVVHKDYQLVVRKVGAACPQRRDCYRIATHVFSWKTSRLFDAEGAEVELAAGEGELIRELILGRPFGSVAYAPSDALRARAGFAELCQRLSWGNL